MRLIWITLSLAFLLGTVISCKQDKKEPASKQGSANPMIDELTQQIKKDTSNAELYFKRGDQYYKKEAYDEAINDLRHAIKIDSLQPLYYHLLADSYLDYYKSREALETMERAAEVFPKRIPTLLKLSEYQLILKQYEGGQITIQRILQIDPQNSEAYLMGANLFHEVKDFPKAKAGYQKALEMGLIENNDQIDAYINLGKLYLPTDKKLAKKFYDNALRIDSTSSIALHSMAEYYQDSKDFKSALKQYRKIIIQDPTYADAFYNSGILYSEMDSLKQAYNNFNIAVQTEPTEAAYYFARADILDRMGKKDEAKRDFDQAKRLDRSFNGQAKPN